MKELTTATMQRTLNKQERRLTIGLGSGQQVELLLRSG